MILTAAARWPSDRPQFSMCLRDLAEKKLKDTREPVGTEAEAAAESRQSRHEGWARGSLNPDETLRVGFPDLRRQWQRVLGKDDGGSTDARPQSGDDHAGRR